jgi:ectoine hydroxylase-related dioxygenase (phytanoyl-CoA dioxygenase family)
MNRDYAEQEGNRFGKFFDHGLSYSALLALNDGTRINLQNNQTIDLNQGDLIVFSGNLKHGGAAYDRRNIRLHFYIEHESHRKDPKLYF